MEEDNATCLTNSSTHFDKSDLLHVLLWRCEVDGSHRDEELFSREIFLCWTRFDQMKRSFSSFSIKSTFRSFDKKNKLFSKQSECLIDRCRTYVVNRFQHGFNNRWTVDRTSGCTDSSCKMQLKTKTIRERNKSFKRTNTAACCFIVETSADWLTSVVHSFIVESFVSTENRRIDQEERRVLKGNMCVCVCDDSPCWQCPIRFNRDSVKWSTVG